MADDPKKINPTSLAGAMAATQSSVDADGEDQFSDIQKEMRSRYELLPDDIKQAIVDDGYQMKLFNIAKAQKLTYEELGTLELDTTMVLLGMITPEEYRDEIQTDLKKNDPEVDALVKAVNEQVFAPLRSSLDRVFSAKRDADDYLPERNVDGSIIEQQPGAAAPAPTSFAAPAPKPVMPAAAAPMPSAPAPMPAARVMPSPALSAQDKSLLEKTGVVINETPAAAPVGPIGSRNDLLQSIENPTKTAPASIVADKLKTAAPVMPAAKTTDYTIAKPAAPATPVTPAAPAAPASPAPRTGPDPYRESIS